MMKIAIFDRDGTLNPLGDDYLSHPDQWQPLPGALQAVAQLNRAGWHTVVACNQPGLGGGLLDASTLNAIHAKLLRQLSAQGGRMDALFFCPHVADDACGCRLPAPGLLAQIAERYGVEPRHLYVVASDPALLHAAAALGCSHLHLVCSGQSAHLQPGQALPPELPPATRLHADLGALVTHLLGAPAPAPLP